MEKTFFISGIGGQGVQVLCKALATVVDECGMNMCLFPWYQGQRRGGATFGRLIISDERVGAPEKRHYDVCVYLDPASLRDYADKRRKGGLVIVNSDLVELPDFDDVTVVSAPFSSTAESAGNERSFNLVVGGFLAAYTKIVPEEKLRRALLEKTADGITDEVVAAAYSDRLVEAAAGFRGFSAACGIALAASRADCPVVPVSADALQPIYLRKSQAER